MCGGGGGVVGGVGRRVGVGVRGVLARPRRVDSREVDVNQSGDRVLDDWPRPRRLIEDKNLRPQPSTPLSLASEVFFSTTASLLRTFSGTSQSQTHVALIRGGVIEDTSRTKISGLGLGLELQHWP